jgi:hypothetical protein
MSATYDKLIDSIPSDSQSLVSSEYGTIVAHKFNDRTKLFSLTIIQSYRSKRLHFYSVKSPDQVSELFVKIVEREKASEERRNKWKLEKEGAKRRFLAALKPGTILHGSWGYEQTNCEFFKVLSVNGVKVEIQEIGYKRVEETSWASAYVMPDPEILSGEPITKTVAGNGITLHSSCTLHLWDGKKAYSSWYY